MDLDIDLNLDLEDVDVSSIDNVDMDMDMYMADEDDSDDSDDLSINMNKTNKSNCKNVIDVKANTDVGTSKSAVVVHAHDNGQNSKSDCRTCSNCGATKTYKWHKDKVNKDMSLVENHLSKRK